VHDLKTHAKNDQEQTGLLTIVKGFSDDIKLKFGLDKCAKATFKKENKEGLPPLKTSKLTWTPLSKI